MAAPADRSVLTFAAGGQRWAIDAEAVAEVVEPPKLTRVPQAPGALTGLANLRGRVAPIVSVAALLGQPVSTGGRVIVLAGGEPMGLAVDEVTSMRRLGEEADDGDIIRLLDFEPLLKGAFAGLGRTAGVAAQAASGRQVQDTDADDTVAFLAFELAGQTYALPMGAVEEVAPWPDSLTRLPDADDVALGVMPVRGALLPLVSLKALLGLPAGEGPGAAVVVAALGGQAIGLAVDTVSAILRLPDDALRSVPTVLNRGAGEARIAALARTPAGLVSVLAADQIFREETVAKILADQTGNALQTEAEASMNDDEAAERFILFRLGDERYGLPIAAIDEVIALPERWTRVPRAPGFVLGVINHRGVVLPLVDQRRRFQVEGEQAGVGRRVIVTRLGETAVGFVVDSVERILTVAPESLASAPDLTQDDAAVFDRVSTLDADGGLVLLVDPRQLLDQAERDLLKALVAKSPGGSVQAS